MKKDLNSYHSHDAAFKSSENNYENTLKGIANYDKVKQFERLGFRLAINLTKNLPKHHIDIGSGNGWLLRKMSPFFETTTGIEPSLSAVNLCKKVHEKIKNIVLINKDMCDGLDELNIKEPVFITTATVLDHIEDFYVTTFLKKVNELPVGSIIFFDERYNKNQQWNRWHVRHQDWWRERLPSWQLVFLDIDIDGFDSGIYGIRVENEGKLKNRMMTNFEKLLWRLDLIRQQGLRVLRKVSKIF